MNLKIHFCAKFSFSLLLILLSLTTNRNWPPLSSTLLNKDTVAGMLGTQCRQEKEVTRENEAALAEMKEDPCEESSCWNVMLGVLGW